MERGAGRMTSEQSADRPGRQTVEDLFAPAPPRPVPLPEPWETVPPGALHENGAEVPDLATVHGVTDRSGFATVYPGTDVLSPKNVASPYDTVASPPIAAGKQAMVPGYEILRELGRGGMGVVYLARQMRPSRLVAVKMVLTGAHAGTEELTRFRREIEAVASVSHPNPVPVSRVGGAEGRPLSHTRFSPAVHP